MILSFFITVDTSLVLYQVSMAGPRFHFDAKTGNILALIIIPQTGFKEAIVFFTIENLKMQL